MPGNSFIKEFSRQTGLSLRSLAVFAGTAQSILSRYGSGTRGMPPEAIVTMAKLYKQAVSFSKTVLAKPAAADKALAKEQANWCLVQCIPLQKKLAIVAQNYRQAGTALLVLGAYQKSSAPFTGKQQRWIDEQRYQAQKKIAKNDWTAQQKLTIKIALLQQEATLWQDAFTAKK